MKRLVLTDHAEKRAKQYGFTKVEIARSFKKARRIELSRGEMRMRLKRYGSGEKKKIYLRSKKILFIVIKKTNGYLCLTLMPV